MVDLFLFCLPQLLIVPLAFFWAGCPCCGACDIFSDNFGTDDSLSGWTQTTGSWSEPSGYAQTSSSNAKLTCDTTHPDAVPSHYVEVSMYGADTDELRVHVGTTHFAQVTIGDPNGCLALYDGATLLTKIRVSAPATTAKTLKVWYGQTPVADGNDSQFAAQWDSGTILRYNVTRAGNGVALGTGTVGSTVRFDDFVYKKHYTSTDTSCPKPDAPTCTIVTDDFTRADSSNIGCLWDEVSGGWSISGNKLRVATTSAIAECQCLHPQDAGAISISVTFRSSAADKIRVYTDTDANDYAEADISGDTLKLFKAGVECRSTSVTLNTSTDYTIVVTRAQNGISATIGTACVVCDQATPAAATYVGLGTGTTVGGNVDFDDFVLSRGYNSSNLTCQKLCSECTALCDNGDPITALVLRFDGVADGTCTNCDELVDGVEFEIPIVSSSLGGCSGQLTISDYVCVGTSFQISIQLYVDGRIYIFGGAGGTQFATGEEFDSDTDPTFYDDDPFPPDCATFFPREIANSGVNGAANCTTTGSTTCTLVRVVQ